MESLIYINNQPPVYETLEAAMQAAVSNDTIFVYGPIKGSAGIELNTPGITLIRIGHRQGPQFRPPVGRRKIPLQSSTHGGKVSHA